MRMCVYVPLHTHKPASTHALPLSRRDCFSALAELLLAPCFCFLQNSMSGYNRVWASGCLCRTQAPAGSWPSGRGPSCPDASIHPQSSVPTLTHAGGPCPHLLDISHLLRHTHFLLCPPHNTASSLSGLPPQPAHLSALCLGVSQFWVALSPLGSHPPPLHLSSSWKWPQASVSDLLLQPSSPTRCHPEGQGPWACLTAAPGACPSRPCPGRLVTLDPAASFLKQHVQPLPKSAHLPL